MPDTKNGGGNGVHKNAERPMISEAGMRIMRQLVGHPPQTMSDLVQALHVTRNAVTEQMDELIARNLVRQTLEDGKRRGRPRYLFTATENAMRHLFDGHQDIVVPTMWRMVRKYYGDEAVGTLVDEIAREVSDFYRCQMKCRTCRDRAREFVDLLIDNGRLIECRETRHCIDICKFNCPFASMADVTGNLCCVDRVAMQLIIGNGKRAPVRLVASRNEGNPCCTFRLDLNAKNASAYQNCGLDI